MIKLILIPFGVSIVCLGNAIAEPLSLSEILSKTYENSPVLRSSKSNAEAESALTSSAYTLDDPMIGVSSLDRGQRTTYGMITQKIRFPVKYYIQGKAQKSRALSAEFEHLKKKLSLKKEASTLYYAIYSIQRIIELTKANMAAVKEFARAAEKKYAAGETPQSDSMKAHFEQTRLELELINLVQREDALQEKMKSLVNEAEMPRLDLSGLKLKAPEFYKGKIAKSFEELRSSLSESSPELKSRQHKVKAADWNKSLSKWEFAPDIQLQYQKRIDGGPRDSEIFSVNLTVPLYFWKKSAKASAASAMKLAEEHKYTAETLKLIAKVNDLKGRATTNQKTLKIFETSLIPQAEGAYNSSKAAYRANKASFLNLLDSERSLYQVKTNYYRSLELYIKSISELEEHLGFSVSNLEGGQP